MSSSCLQAAPVELGKLRELIAVDRSHAGEARQAEIVKPLTTVAYSKPLRVRLRRRWRRDPSLRRATWTAGLVVLLWIALWLVPPFWTTAGAKSAPRAGAAASEAPAAAPVVARQPASAPAVATPNPSVPSPSPVAPEPAPLSSRRRMQRADLWLRIGSERGNREARSLLESALREVPHNPHGNAALAEACLRLQDQACARDAVSAALEVRPWRGAYRTLARKIDAAFATSSH